MNLWAWLKGLFQRERQYMAISSPDLYDYGPGCIVEKDADVGDNYKDALFHFKITRKEDGQLVTKLHIKKITDTEANDQDG